MTTSTDPFATSRLTVEEKHRVDIDDRRVLSLTVVQLAPGVVEPTHTHPGFEILFGLAGRGHVDLDGTRTPLNPGQVVYVPDGTVKAITNDSDQPLSVLAVLVLDRGRPPVTPVTGAEQATT
jgi:quercetin dioxygenase-like cupin family protein